MIVQLGRPGFIGFEPMFIDFRRFSMFFVNIIYTVMVMALATATVTATAMVAATVTVAVTVTVPAAVTVTAMVTVTVTVRGGNVTVGGQNDEHFPGGLPPPGPPDLPWRSGAKYQRKH